jgi:glycerol uptake facilitator protein
MLNIFIAELMGTMFLILLGNGVVANVLLKKTGGHGGGIIAITAAWGFAVFVGATVANSLGSAGELNPATVIAGWVNGAYKTEELFPYISGELIGAMLGAGLVWLQYKDHFDATSDEPGLQKACFCTAPSIKNTPLNFFSETIGAFVLLYVALSFQGAEVSLGSVGKWPITTLIWVIGLSLGGTTGYAINPARDLGPRIMHAILPMKGKGSTDWGYAWIPVLGPIVGTLVAIFLFNLLH